MDKTSPSSATQGNKSEQGHGTPQRESVLETKRRELEQARVEYYAVKEIVEHKKQTLGHFSDYLSECESTYGDLVAERDEINETLRDKRSETGQLEKALQAAQAELSRRESTAKDIRREAVQAKKKVEQALRDKELAKAEHEEAEARLAMAIQQVKAAQASFRTAGGKLTKGEVLFNESNPWKTGSFYLVAAVVLIVVLAIISANLSWYAVITVLIGGLLALAVVGALQLRSDESLSEENFLKLMLETFRRLPLLRRDNTSSDPTESKSPESK